MTRILNSDVLTNHGDRKGRSDMFQILEAGMEAADPYYNVHRLLKFESGVITIGNPDFDPIGCPWHQPLQFSVGRDIDRIFVFGAGKGIQRIAKAIEDILGDNVSGGLIIVKHGDSSILSRIKIKHGSHPVPDETCVVACQDLLQEIDKAKLTKRDLVFIVIGNGVSSLLTLPPEGVKLESVKKITEILQIQKGLGTIEMNKVRVQVDMLKGGRLTRRLYPANLIHFFGIDINERFASGKIGYEAWTTENSWLHSLPDASSPEKAIEYLKTEDAFEMMPQDVKNYLETKANANPVLTLTEFEDWGGRFYGLMPKALSFLPAVEKKCTDLGYVPYHMCSKTNTEASVTGSIFGQIAKQIAMLDKPFKAPCAMLITGELQVTVGHSSGIGGRNQEFQLALAKMIDGVPGIVGGGVDTDGTDGPGGDFSSDASKKGCRILAGAIVDSLAAKEARRKGIDIAFALKNHSTSNALWALDSGVWASQCISVNDLIVILIRRI